ncbi:MAG: VCBS repeat-containing protein, partial [Nitrospirales bacterium]
MSTHVIPYLTGLTRTIMALILVGMVCLSVPSQGLAYKIEIGVSGPIGGDSVTEENGRTEIKLDTGPVIGPDGEAGSAFATANLATGTLALKVTSTTPDQSSQEGMGLASIQINDRLTFKLDPGVSVANIRFSMRVDGFPSCQDLSSNCFTNAIIGLGDVSDQALGLPLPEPKVLEISVTVVDGQELPIEAFLSARVEMNNLIDVSDPSATIRLILPKGVSFTSESGVFLGLQSPWEEPSPRAPVNSDLNGDGKADIVWRNLRTGEVAVWLMNGGLIGSSGFLGGVSSNWQIVGVGDVDNDGMSD